MVLEETIRTQRLILEEAMSPTWVGNCCNASTQSCKRCALSSKRAHPWDTDGKVHHRETKISHWLCKTASHTQMRMRHHHLTSQCSRLMRLLIGTTVLSSQRSLSGMTSTSCPWSKLPKPGRIPAWWSQLVSRHAIVSLTKRASKWPSREVSLKSRLMHCTCGQKISESRNQ